MGPDFASYNFEWLTHAAMARPLLHARPGAALRVHEERCACCNGVAGSALGVMPAAPRAAAGTDADLPDATIVFTHRDPVAVLQSTVTMQAAAAHEPQAHGAACAARLLERSHGAPAARSGADRDCAGAQRRLPFSIMADQMGDGRVYKRPRSRSTWPHARNLRTTSPIIRAARRGRWSTTSRAISAGSGRSLRRFGFYSSASRSSGKWPDAAQG